MKFAIKKMIVAADDNSTADAIAALRNQLAGGGETMVNQDGTVLNPADPASASSLANGDGFKPVDKAVVAADDESAAAAIAALREQLNEGGEVGVTPTGGAEVPSDNPATDSSVNKDSGFKPIDKAVVAADDNSTADAIAALRNQLAGGGETMVNQDGTVLNPADPASASSLANGDGFKPVDKAVVAADDESAAAAIAALREQLNEGGEVGVTPTGGAEVPSDNPATDSSVNKDSSFKPVDKAVVAADDNSTADAIAALRNQLAGGGETMVNQDGTVLNPADPASASSLANGDGFKPVDKAVVAADDESAAAAIAALREQLNEGGEVGVTPTGGAEVPSDNPATDSSVNKDSGFKPIDKAVVAADDNSTADAIAALRNQLAGGGETMVNQDGTVLNPADPASASSLANGDGFKPVDKAVVAVEWYRTNPQLQKLEIKAMADIHPDAKMGYLPNGKMYWQIRIHPVVCGSRKDWTLLAVYDSDHPQQRWGGSVKFYPVKPNYDEMMQMVNRSRVTPKSIPHLLRDDDGQIYMCTQDRNNIYAGTHKGEKVTTAAACLRFAMRWITVFELGLIDQKTWSLFQEHGKI